MKKLLIGLGALVALLIVAILTVPSLIDWNSYKGLIAEQVKAATGRDLVIAGDIEAQILPAPAVFASKVAFSSVDGAQSPDLVAIDEVEVRVALAPLLAGKIQVERVRLVQPQIFLEVLSDGRTSWAIEAPNGDTGAAPETPTDNAAGADAGGGGPEIIIDGFEIVDGTLEYADAASNTVERIGDIDLELEAASLLSGPYRVNGSLVAQGLRLGVRADVGAIVEARTFPLDMAVSLGGDAATISLVGTVLGLDTAPRFQGDLNISSPDIGAVVAAATQNAIMPEPLQQPLAFKGQLDASTTALSFEDFVVELGGAVGSGSVSGSFEGTPRLNAEIAIDRIDADPWITQASTTTGASSNGTAVPSTAGGASAPIPADATAEKAAAPFSLPSGIEASAVLRVGEISVNGGSVRNLVIDGQLANGEVVLNQAALTGPGGTTLGLFGLLAARDGKAVFDGQLNAEVADFQALKTWAEIEVPGIAAGQPEKLSLRTAVEGQGNTLSVKELFLNVDETNIAGAATVVMAERLGLGLSLNVDTLNLDRYLAATEASTESSRRPGGAPSSDGSDAEASEGGAPTPGQSQSANAQRDDPLAGLKEALAPLTTFDANIVSKIGRLIYNGLPVRDINVDLGIQNGVVTLRNVAVGNVASASATVSGVLRGLSDTPNLADFAIRAGIPDPGATANAFGLDLPMPAANIGAVQINADIDGQLDAPNVAATVDAFAGRLTANGAVQPFNLAQAFVGNVQLSHADAAGLLRRLGVAYRPSGAIGGLTFASRVNAGTSAVTLSELSTKVGEAEISGQAQLDITGAVPKIVGDFATNEIRIDPFVPAQQTGSNANGVPARMIPARFDADDIQRLFMRVSTVSDRWSRDPLDLSALSSINAEIGLRSPAMHYDVYTMRSIGVTSSLDNGLLSIPEFTGQVFGGAFKTDLRLDASGASPTIAGLITLGNMDIGTAAKSVGVDGATGSLTTRLDVATRGASIADWVSALDGQGALEVRGVKATRSLSDVPIIGVTFGPLLTVFEVLNSGLGTLIGAGARTGIGDTDITSTFNIADGIVNTSDMSIISNLYKGNITGDIDLPAWTMNVGGNVAMDQGLVGSLLSNVVRIPTRIPFQVTGSIDQPNVKLQSLGNSGGQGGGSQIPGLDRLEQRVPGVGGLIQGILGGGGQAPAPQQQAPQQTDPSSPPSQQPPAQQPSQQRSNPAEQLLRGILGN